MLSREVKGLTEEELERALKYVAQVQANLETEEHRLMFLKCAAALHTLSKKGNVPDKSETLRQIIVKAWSVIKGGLEGRDPNFADNYGLKNIVQLTGKQVLEILTMLKSSSFITIVGEDFSWVKESEEATNALTARLLNGQRTRVITAHPDLKTAPDMDGRLRKLTLEVIGENWDKCRESVKGELLAKFIGVRRELPYTLIMDDSQLWIRHRLASTASYRTLWNYVAGDHPENFHAQIASDMEGIDSLASRDPRCDLIERYRPKNPGKRTSSKTRKV